VNLFTNRSRLGKLAAGLGFICLALTMNADTNAGKALFDFQTTTNQAGWQVVNDDVMGGVSRSAFTVTNGAAVFRGEVSLANNGGFASVRSQPARHDLSGCQTFVLRVRGDGRRYKFTVRTETGWDAPLYQVSFPTKRGVWEEQRLAMKDFVPTFRGRVLTGAPPLDPAKVVSVGLLIADQQAGPFEIQVASVRADR
jgi:monofunctional biosynthetic peptidoglycan transglycosylase